MRNSKRTNLQSKASTLLNSLSFKLHDLAMRITRNVIEGTGSVELRREANSTLTVIYSSRGMGHSLIGEDDLIRMLGPQHQYTLDNVVEINMWAYQCNIRLDQQKRKEAADRTSAYRRFLEKAIKHKNAQILHAMVKPKPDVIARAVETKSGVTTTNQAHADEQI